MTPIERSSKLFPENLLAEIFKSFDFEKGTYNPEFYDDWLDSTYRARFDDIHTYFKNKDSESHEQVFRYLLIGMPNINNESLTEREEQIYSWFIRRYMNGTSYRELAEGTGHSSTFVRAQLKLLITSKQNSYEDIARLIWGRGEVVRNEANKRLKAKLLKRTKAFETAYQYVKEGRNDKH